VSCSINVYVAGHLGINLLGRCGCDFKDDLFLEFRLSHSGKEILQESGSMINIAFVVSNLRRSGPVNVLYNIVEFLNRDIFTLYIISLSPETINSRDNDFMALGCELVNLNLSRFGSIFLARKRIKGFLYENNIDLVHTHGFRPDVIVSKLKNYKWVSTVHNYPYQDYLMRFNKIKGLLMSYSHIKAIKKCEHAVACSSSLKSIFKHDHGVELILIRNGVDQKMFYPVDTSVKNQLREKLNLPAGGRIFVSVGSLIPRKDPITIIEAFKESDKLKSDVLIFLGDGVLMNECKRRTEKHTNIRLFGMVDEVSEFLQASDFLVSGSLSEGLPNTVLEAMGCGLPCILSDIDPHQELLTIQPNAGLLFPTGNTQDLKELFNDIQEIDYEEMGDSSLRIVQSGLNSETMSKEYQDLYIRVSKGE
jgi:glycosyltransferase involved in cell wall biosynthesis